MANFNKVFCDGEYMHLANCDLAYERMLMIVVVALCLAKRI